MTGVITEVRTAYKDWIKLGSPSRVFVRQHKDLTLTGTERSVIRFIQNMARKTDGLTYCKDTDGPYTRHLLRRK